MTVESLTPLICKPRREFTPIPTFPRGRGKVLNTPSLARSAGEGWGGGKKPSPIMETSIDSNMIYGV